MRMWSYTIAATNGALYDSDPVAWGASDLQADAVRCAMRFMHGAGAAEFVGATITLFKTTKQHGRQTDQVWYVDWDPRRPGRLRARR